MSKRAKPVDAALRDMFQKLEGRPLPEHLRQVIDQLNDEDVEADGPEGPVRAG